MGLVVRMQEEMPPTTELDQDTTEQTARPSGSPWLLCAVHCASREELKLPLHRRRTCLAPLLCCHPTFSRLQRCAPVGGREGPPWYAVRTTLSSIWSASSLCHSHVGASLVAKVVQRAQPQNQQQA